MLAVYYFTVLALYLHTGLQTGVIDLVVVPGDQLILNPCSLLEGLAFTPDGGRLGRGRG